MKIRSLALVGFALFGAALAGCTTLSASSSSHDIHGVSRAQIFEGMGPHTREVTTDSAEAQRYFDQGLTWMYAFNHDEAIRSFTRAAEADPGCAMAWWGIALCQGPNYNDPVMTPERNEASWDALQEALARIDDESSAERALIEALQSRYEDPAPADRAHLESEYAEAMGRVWDRFGNDSDVGTLYAEAMMTKRPWKLYSLEFEPAEDTDEIVLVLETVMKMDPDNPGANHLYIHSVEPSSDPDRGLVAADRLSDMVTASGHLEHMPSHIYVKTGRWNRAIVQNQKAMRADATYRALSPDQGMQHGYMVHNAHMLAFAAMMSGREWEAMAAARAMWNNVPEDVMPVIGPFFDPWMCSVYDVQKRFGRWDDILAEPAPPEYLPVTTAIWRAHRAVAYAAKKDFESAEREYQLFKDATGAIAEDHPWDSQDAAHRVLSVSDHFVAGEIALQRGDWQIAAYELEKAAAIEDTLHYGEPPQWTQPVRHALGAVYLKSGRYEDAERVYREDLAKWRNNGWSLYGLSRALHEQGKTSAAHKVEERYRRAWERADAPTETSCKCIPRV